jgi:hypothetical protein
MTGRALNRYDAWAAISEVGQGGPVRQNDRFAEFSAGRVFPTKTAF